MYRLCLRYAGEEDTALLILNNGFLRVFKKIDSYSFKGSLEGWVRKLIFHAISDYFKSNQGKIFFLEIDNHEAPSFHDTLSNLYLEDLMHLADHLQGTAKEVFFLYAIEGYSHKEIAERCNISEGTSKWYLSMARAELKKMITKYYNTKNYAG